MTTAPSLLNRAIRKARSLSRTTVRAIGGGVLTAWRLRAWGWPPSDPTRHADYHRARIARFAPELTDDDVARLAPHELSTIPATLWLDPPSFDLGQDSTHSVSGRQRPRPPATCYLDSSSEPVAIGPDLPPLRLRIDCTSDGLPTISIESPGDLPSNLARSYHFEFDTSPEFGSPNLWRTPTLLPRIAGPDLADSRLQNLYVLTTTSRCPSPGRITSVRFPFSPACMLLPEDRSSLSADDLTRLAARLGRGLSGRALVRAAYDYVRHSISWGADTAFRPPLSVLRSGLGGCGHVNLLLGVLLELNGIRFRGVASFDPLLREICPDAGHTAIEFLCPETDRWEYIDAYLDVWIPGRSARQLQADQECREIILAAMPEGVDRQLYGQSIDFARIMRYRIYFDLAGRLPQLPMLRLGGNEDAYGRKWQLMPRARASESMCPSSRERTIFARARYIDGDSMKWLRHSQVEGRPIASPWACASFTISDPI